MPRNSFVQMSKLHNVRGRIYYISSDKNRKISMRYMKPQTEILDRTCQVQSGRI